MPDDLDGLSPGERAKILLERSREGLPTVIPPRAVFDPDLIPDAGPVERSPEQVELDRIVDAIDFAQAYVRLIGKMTPNSSNRRKEGIKISCPIPGHPDHDPSAWYNSETKLWFCGGCQVGGDIYDLAAISMGYPWPDGYKNSLIFPELKRRLAETFGYQVIRGIKGDILVPPSSENQEPESQPSLGVVAPLMPAAPVNVGEPPELPQNLDNGVSAQVYSFSTGEQVEEIDTNSDLFIPWEKIAPEETFLRSWMDATTIDDLPHEFYLHLGLMALGFAAGTKNIMLDFQPVKANLYVCLYGKTGMGKSRAMRPFLRMIEDVFPFSHDPHSDPSGVKLVPTPGSSEAMIDSFKHEVQDPSTNKVIRHAGVSGLVRYEELSSLIAKSFGKGATIRETMIQMYDVYKEFVTAHSRSGGVSRVYNPFCQIISTTQPNAIHAFLRKTDVESGFLNRWLFAAGMPRVAPISYGGVTQDISSPAAYLRNIAAWSMNEHHMVLQGDALDAWNEFFFRVLAPFKSGQVEMESIFSRVDLTLKKYIINLTVNEMQDHPTGDIVERALSFYPYLKTTYSAFTTDIAFDDATDCQSRIINICKTFQEKHTKDPSRNDIWRYLNKKFPLETVTRVMKNMVDMQLLEEVVTTQAGRGRPSVKYHYVGA